MTTVYVTHPRYDEHDQNGHPEHAGRIHAVWGLLEKSGLASRLETRTATSAPVDLIRTVHTDGYIQQLEETAGNEFITRLDADTYLVPTSYEIARLSAGGVVDAVEAVLSGQAANSLAVVRPPGHHAMPDRAMGFCLIGNIAVAARYAQQAHGLQRVLIVDYDVHHGNGTEAMFYEDPSVYFISTHQWPLYPGTGALTDTGRGAGVGTTLNLPLPAHTGDTGYNAVFEQVIEPAIRRFQPELILVSVGHDAHWRDPLAHMRLSLNGYAQLAERMKRMADELCGGKVVFVMEGGYDLEVLAHGMTNIARVLVGEPVEDPIGAGPTMPPEPDLSAIIAKARSIHNL